MSTTDEYAAPSSSDPPVGGDEAPPHPASEGADEAPGGVGFAVMFVGTLAVVGALAGAVYLVYFRRKKGEGDYFQAAFGSGRYSMTLPAEVEQYHALKDKLGDAAYPDDAELDAQAEAQSTGAPPAPPQGEERAERKLVKQALLRRAIATVPLILFQQKERSRMEPLFRRGMCAEDVSLCAALLPRTRPVPPRPPPHTHRPPPPPPVHRT